MNPVPAPVAVAAAAQAVTARAAVRTGTNIARDTIPSPVHQRNDTSIGIGTKSGSDPDQGPGIEKIDSHPAAGTTNDTMATTAPLGHHRVPEKKAYRAEDGSTTCTRTDHSETERIEVGGQDWVGPAGTGMAEAEVEAAV